MSEAVVIGLLTLASVLVVFTTALLGLFKGHDNANKIQEVHVLVNSRLTAVVSRVDQLVDTLKRHGIEVPADPADDRLGSAESLPEDSGSPGNRSASPGSP